MTSHLQSVLEQVSHLSEAEQNQLADDLQERIIALKVARGEADIAAGRIQPATDVFQELRERYELAS